MDVNSTVISANQKCTLGQTSNGNASLKYHFENRHEKSSVQTDGYHVEDYFPVSCQYIDQEKFVLEIDHAKSHPFFVKVSFYGRM